MPGYWKILPAEVKFHILSFILKTNDVIRAIDTKNYKAIAEMSKQYAYLRLTSNDIGALSASKDLFNLDAIIKHIIEKHPPYVLKILKHMAKARS